MSIEMNVFLYPTRFLQILENYYLFSFVVTFSVTFASLSNLRSFLKSINIITSSTLGIEIFLEK